MDEQDHESVTNHVKTDEEDNSCVTNNVFFFERRQKICLIY